MPILPARDLDEAVAFYSRLRFAAIGRYPGYALLKRGGAELHLWLCTDRRIAENTACYLRVDAIDRLHGEIAAAVVPEQGPGRVGTPEAKPWGVREFEVRDPSGNLLRFGETPSEPRA